MVKQLGILLSLVLILVLLSPLFLYWWGLSNLEYLPEPSGLKLTSQQESYIWHQEKEVGKPRVKAITAYSYIGHFYCNANNGLYSHQCMDKYPGVRMSALAIRPQVVKQVGDKGNITWQLTWAAYSIWVTRNWNIHQILATYHEAHKL